MRSPSSIAVLCSLLPFVSASAIPPPYSALGKRISTSDSSDENLGNVLNGPDRYTTNVTIDGYQYAVMIDSGSSDLWVVPTDEHKAHLNKTGIPSGVEYGATKTSGEIAVGKISIGKYEVPHQAFIASEKSDSDGDAELGLQGLVGLGFDQSSNINNEVKKKYGKTTTWGQTFMSNYFSLSSSNSRAMGISLSRTNDSEGTADSSLYFSEVDSDYYSVTDTPSISLYPKDATSWDVLIEDISVDGKSVPLKTTVTTDYVPSGVPSNRLMATLDTGGGSILLPYSTLHAIFANVEGAVEDKGEYKNASSASWYLPCNASNVVEFTIGGQKIPINPLDLSQVNEGKKPNGDGYYYCTADVTPIEAYDAYLGAIDGLLSPPFLRNVYTLFSFGEADSTGKDTSYPYVQMLPVTDAKQAAYDVEGIREQNAPSKYRVSPAEALKYLTSDSSDSSSSDSSASSGSSSSSSGSSSSSSNNSSSDKADLADDDELSSAAAAGADSSSSSGDSFMNQYGKIIIGLLGANLVIGIVLVVMAVLFYVRKGGVGRAKGRGKYAPLKEEHGHGHGAGDYHD